MKDIGLQLELGLVWMTFTLVLQVHTPTLQCMRKNNFLHTGFSISISIYDFAILNEAGSVVIELFFIEEDIFSDGLLENDHILPINAALY